MRARSYILITELQCVVVQKLGAVYVDSNTYKMNKS